VKGHYRGDDDPKGQRHRDQCSQAGGRRCHRATVPRTLSDGRSARSEPPGKMNASIVERPGDSTCTALFANRNGEVPPREFHLSTP
jgi:hypothetical protein